MQRSCAVTLLVITFLLITTMATLTPVTTENMETFNKRLSEERPFASSSSVGMRSAGLNQGPAAEAGSLIHTYPTMEEGSLIRRQASSLYQQDMQSKQASTADVKSSTHASTITGVVAGNLNCNKDDINKTINKASSAIAATAPSNSTLSHASFIRKGREQEEEKTRSKNDNDNNNNNHDIDNINMNNDDDLRFSSTAAVASSSESSSSLTPMPTTTVNDCSQALEGVIEVMENMENSSKSTAKIGATSVASSPEGRCVKFFYFFFLYLYYLLFSTFSTTETCNFETH